LLTCFTCEAQRKNLAVSHGACVRDRGL
jgi:hypothetical protein